MFRYGNLTTTRNFIKDFKLQDIGWLYVTDQRFIFQGQHKNIYKSVNLDSVLQFKLFEDGILLAMDRKNKPLIKFFHQNIPNKPDDPLIINDGLNVLTRLLVRVLNKDY